MSTTTKQPKKRNKGWYAGNRNQKRESRAALQSLRVAVPQLLQLSQKYDKRFAAHAAELQGDRVGAENRVLGESGMATREAMLAAAPEHRLASAKLMAGLNNVGPSAIETKLRQQAESDLALGGQLSPDELRDIQQGERAAMQDRGMLYGPGASVSEILARVGASNARQRERQAFAANVEGLSQAREQQDRSFTLQATDAAKTYDPYQRIFGNPAPSATGALYGQALGTADQIGQDNQRTLQAALLARREDTFNRNQMALDWQSFQLNRKDSRAAGHANAAAAKDAGQTSAWASAGASAAMLALAFL